MSLPPLLAERPGFDYAAAVRELHRYLTYDQIAEYCGYESKRSILNVLTGAIPDHPKGEAIYILFVEMFRMKPPQRRVNVQSAAPLPAT